MMARLQDLHTTKGALPMKTLAGFFLALVLSIPAFSQEAGPRFYDMPYDTVADPFAQIQAAQLTAVREHKLILLDVGGEWCVWCHRLDTFFRTHADVAEYLEAHYVPVKINYSLANKNEPFLSTMPKVPGFPHLFVLDEDGKLVHSQDTAELEEGKGYSTEHVMAFLRKWVEGRPKI